MTDAAANNDPLAFTPVPLARSRHDGWTPRRQRLFIDRLALIGLVSAAAKSVGDERQVRLCAAQTPGRQEFR